MKWTLERPTIAGEYWYSEGVVHNNIRTFSEMVIATVHLDNNGNPVVLFPGVLGNKPIELLNGEWWGPLDPPPVLPTKLAE